jgi:hypothetical protein
MRKITIGEPTRCYFAGGVVVSVFFFFFFFVVDLVLSSVLVSCAKTAAAPANSDRPSMMLNSFFIRVSLKVWAIVPDYRFMMAALDELDLKRQLKMLHLLTPESHRLKILFVRLSPQISIS